VITCIKVHERCPLLEYTKFDDVLNFHCYWFAHTGYNEIYIKKKHDDWFFGFRVVGLNIVACRPVAER
jgi:hypothetical protein